MRVSWRAGAAGFVVFVVVILVFLFPWMVKQLPQKAVEMTRRREQARVASALSNVTQAAPAMQAFEGKVMGAHNALAEQAMGQQAQVLYDLNVAGVSPTEGRVSVPGGYPLQAPERTDVDLDIEVLHKKVDDVYLTRYDATFKGDYVFRNPNPDWPSRIVLTFPFPPNADTLAGVTMTVDGEDATDTRVSDRGITWAGWFKPKESKTIHVEYEARGIDDFSYAVDHARLNKYFRLVANVSGVRELELPNECLRAREQKATQAGVLLTWFHKDLVTSRDIIIDLPDREPEMTFTARLQEYAGRFTVLCRVAPIFALLFLGAIALSGRVGAPKLDPESHVLLSLNFLLFYPLLIFLSGSTGVTTAFWIGAAVTTAIGVLYAWRAGGRGMLWRGVLFYAVFLGLFSYAVLHERWTGLLLSSGGITIVAFFMLSHGLWPPEPTEPPEPAEPEPPADLPPPAAPLPARGSFCAHCGAALGEAFQFCPSCAKPVHATATCASCGAQACSECGKEFAYCPTCGAEV